MSRAIGEKSALSTEYQFAATHPTILSERPANCMNRTEMHRLMNERFTRDPVLRRSLLDHPQAIYAVVVEECFGIHRSLFFVQISHVEVIIEDEATLGVVLTACHLGCVAPRLPTCEELTASQCHICNHRERICHSEHAQSTVPEANRACIRTWIQNRAQGDEKFRERLMASPAVVWSQILSELNLPLSHPLHRIQTIRLFVESAETIGFVLECNSEPVSAIPYLPVNP